MKKVERKLNKAQLATVWLLIISVLLGVAYFAVILVIKNLSEKEAPQTGSTVTDKREEEGLYLNQLVAYPAVEEANITFIEVENEYGRFGVSRYPNDNGDFLFHYYRDEDGDGKLEEQIIPYTPPIIGAEGSFDYKSLYAVEGNDGYGMIYYLTYLCAAIGSPYISERIDLPTDQEKRDALLRDYGLTKSATVVSFEYGERDGKNGPIIESTLDAHVIVIGDKALSGTGYYFWVDGRDYVYYTSSEYFSYAMAGFHEFINGMVVAGGLEGDALYGPYLTTDFKKWTTTQYKSESDRVFEGGLGEYKNFESPNVVTNGSYYTSVDKGLEYVPDGDVFSGYETKTNIDFSFNLETLKDHPDYERIKNTLVGKNVGKYTDDQIILTLLTEAYDADEKQLDIVDGGVNYKYSISKIESVLTNDGEKRSGTVTDGDKLVKVTYRYTVGDKTVAHDCHAVLDLTSIDTESASLFLGQPIGESVSLELDIVYTKDNAYKASEKYVLTSVDSIFTVDESGNGAIVSNVITEDTYVTISYYRVFGNTKTDIASRIVRLSDIKEGDKLYPLRDILLGNGKGNYGHKVVYDNEFYYEVMREFTTYEISEIEYFVANEIVVSFSFANASDRDPFYGETFYKNTLTNEYSLYGLNAGSCETAVKLLGGVGTDSNSAVGLSGTTVAIGLTLDNMEYYGLYAHKVYFEMPRGIYDASEEDGTSVDDELSDYGWLGTLGFTLYFSNVQYDNGERIRYVGSDMYDVIVKVPADDFEFLEQNFVDFWARKNLMMMDITKLSGLKLEFNMSDLKGVYDFEILFKTEYAGYVNGEYVIDDEKFDGSSPIKNQSVKIKASEDAFDTAFKQEFGADEWGNLASLYDKTMGGGKPTYYPGTQVTLGATYFNSVYETLLLTRYLDTLTEEEQQKALEGEAIMKMHFESPEKAYNYTYEFYRLDDRRIAVRFYRSDKDGNKKEDLGEVHDYYISAFAFKKLVNNYIYLLNGKEIDGSIGYP